MRIVSGPWEREDIERWFHGARIPVRVAVTGRHGPRVVSLWYRYQDDGDPALWCATPGEAAIVGLVAADPRVGFEVAPDIPPYRGVRGTGHATVVPARGPEVLDALIERYLDAGNAGLADWLRRRSDTEVALRIGTLRVSSWDFSTRMRPQESGPVLPPPPRPGTP